MTNKKYFWTIASFLSVLIISLPITLAQEINYVTDANGNLVTGDSFYREYNELNQLIRVRQGNTSNGQILEEYEWHPVEERILIKDVFSNGVKNYTVYYVNKEYIVIENSTGNYTEEYIYQDGVLVAQVDTNGNKLAVHSDYEGSTTTITDADGNVAEQTFFGPYGQIISGGQKSRYDYEGKEFDSVVEDYDFNFRKYKPEPPIFTQPDTLIKNVYDPQLLNRYMFERGNPYKYTDPTGHQSEGLLNAVRTLGWPGLIIGVLIATAYFIWAGIDRDPDQSLHNKRIVEQVEQDIANQEQTQEPKEQFPPVPKTIDGTYVPPEAIEEQERLGNEICERANIDCGEDSRLKLKIDPTIYQDKYISKLPEEKKEEPKSTGGPSGSSGGSGPYGCSWWAECIVTYDSLA